MYSKGLGVSKDDAEAARWTRKAADQGSAEGQFALWFHVRAWQGCSAERDRGCRMVSEGGKPERHSRYEQSRHVARYVERSENRESPSDDPHRCQQAEAVAHDLDRRPGYLPLAFQGARACDPGTGEGQPDHVALIGELTYHRTFYKTTAPLIIGDRYISLALV